MVSLADSVWLNTQFKYRGIDDTPTEKAYQINNWMILHTIGDTFNVKYRIRDSIGDGFNGKGNSGCS